VGLVYGMWKKRIRGSGRGKEIHLILGGARG